MHLEFFSVLCRIAPRHSRACPLDSVLFREIKAPLVYLRIYKEGTSTSPKLLQEYCRTLITPR